MAAASSGSQGVATRVELRGGDEMPDGEIVTEQKKQTGPFNNALTATLIVVGSVAVLAYVFDQAFNDDDEPSTLPPPVSPSTLAD